MLGCILQLAEAEEDARFWWQYAAGAGDAASSYCLYLHHLALGERGEVRWWHHQTELVQESFPATDTIINTPAEPAGDVPAAVTAALTEVTSTSANLLPTVLRIRGALASAAISPFSAWIQPCGPVTRGAVASGLGGVGKGSVFT
ncbi:hypothetical protein [Streptomyces sp. NPDC052042]|uniref:hypothetical protein n=1 Tax=Streptomyces sp. NPDC052042 TaxID=3365683 RepID=UPI0037CCED68